MPLPVSETTEEMLYVDQERALADFTFDSALGCYQAPPPYRVLMALPDRLRPSDLRQGLRLAVHLSWAVIQEKRWRHVQVLRAIPSAPSGMDSAASGPITEVEPTDFSVFLARAPRADRPGGARGAVGRKALVAGEFTEAHSITLPASVWRRLEEIGGGNRSEGVRRLVEERESGPARGPVER